MIKLTKTYLKLISTFGLIQSISLIRFTHKLNKQLSEIYETTNTINV